MNATVREKPLARKVSEAQKLAEATELGKQLGDYRGQKRKPLEVAFKEHIGKFIDNFRASDIIEISAWIGLAYLIKPLLQRAASLQPMMMASKAAHQGSFLKDIEPFETADTIANYVETLLLGKPIPVSPEVAAAIVEDIRKADLEWWLLSLAVSALIMKYGPSILQSMGGISKLGSLLLL